MITVLGVPKSCNRPRSISEFLAHVRSWVPGTWIDSRKVPGEVDIQPKSWLFRMGCCKDVLLSFREGKANVFIESHAGMKFASELL